MNTNAVVVVPALVIRLGSKVERVFPVNATKSSADTLMSMKTAAVGGGGEYREHNDIW